MLYYGCIIYLFFVFQGCKDGFTSVLMEQLNIISAVGLGICVIQVFGMILSCCLYLKLRYVTDFEWTYSSSDTIRPQGYLYLVNIVKALNFYNLYCFWIFNLDELFIL